MNIITMIVDRLHVSLSSRQLIREIKSRLQPGVPRESRKFIYKVALDRHAENFKQYVEVMR